MARRMTTEDTIYYVYLHIKETNGEPFYVGKGKHRRVTAKNGRSTHWKRVVNKYGYDIIILNETKNENIAFEQEKYWIKRIGRKDLGLGSLVNFTDGGEGCSNIIISDETRRKMKISNTNKNKGRKHTNESKKNMSLAQKGKHVTDETKEKISIANTGKIACENIRKRASETHKNKKYTNEIKLKISESHKKHHSKIILQYDKNNNFIKKWNNQYLAAEFYNISIGSIIRVCEGKRKTIKNYIWKYES